MQQYEKKSYDKLFRNKTSIIKNLVKRRKTQKSSYVKNVTLISIVIERLAAESLRFTYLLNIIL